MLKILIVEDNLAFKEALIKLLSGYEIIGIAEDGLSAIRLLEKACPDLLILDLSIPKISGISVLKKIRQFYPQLRILVLTMHDSLEYYKACMENGADAFVLKDEGSKKLKDVIQRVIAGEKYSSPGIDDPLKSSKML